MNDKDFLQFLFDRLCIVYGESENYDYMQRFKSIIDKVGTEQAQTFYVIKRDEEPAYWHTFHEWTAHIEYQLMSLPTAEMHLSNLKQKHPTARIVKVMVSEVEG